MSKNTQNLEGEEQRTFLQQWLVRLNRFLKPYVSMGPFEAALALTLVIFCIERNSQPQLLMLCTFGLIVRHLARSGVYWALITVVFLLTHWINWNLSGNHWYVWTYWLFAITLSLFCPEPKKALAESARWLIVLVFGFSAFWKLASPEYMDGRYFDYCILADIRFTPVGLLAGIDGQTALANRDLLAAYIYLADPASSVQLVTTKWVKVGSYFLTWRTLLIELSVVLSLALPKRKISHFWRHVPLIVFIYTTYSLAQVNGFGWVLAAMGMSQIKKDAKPIYLGLYLASFIFVFCSTHPGLRGLLAHLNML